MTLRYPVAERFFAPQGEGQYAGTQMAFIRLVGCSVGKGICTHCDTEFDKVREDLGGGLYWVKDLIEWVGAVQHVCLTGGEPLDRDLRPLLLALQEAGKVAHVETSGTVRPAWLQKYQGEWRIADDKGEVDLLADANLWVTVSPKPGYREDMIADADEVKVILGGLGDGPGWPTLEDAVGWADFGHLVYIQPRNEVLDVNPSNLRQALKALDMYPQLRLSVQAHKFWKTR